MGTMSDVRESRMTAAMRELRDGLNKVGLRLMTPEGYRGRAGYKPTKVDDYWHRHVVLNSDDQVIAAVDMNRGTGWHSHFNGWQVRLPTYEPRGDYNTRQHRLDPSDYAHWGFANIKSTGTAVEKIKAAEASLPTEIDIQIGKLHQDLQVARSQSRRAEMDRKYTFSHPNVLDEVYDLLASLQADGRHLSAAVLSDMTKYEKARKNERKADKKIESILAEIQKLEQQKVGE